MCSMTILFRNGMCCHDKEPNHVIESCPDILKAFVVRLINFTKNTQVFVGGGFFETEIVWLCIWHDSLLFLNTLGETK